MKKKFLYITVFSLFLVGVGSLVISSVMSESVYFLNVSEALAMPSNELKSARLFGNVAQEGIEQESALDVAFILIDAEDASKKLKVQYKGAIPDTFGAGSEVIIEGSLNNDVFHAKSLMTKCPSKYEKENRG